MIVKLALIQHLQFNIPRNHDRKSLTPLSGNATHPKLKCQDCRRLWRMKQKLKLRDRGVERAQNTLLIMGSRSYLDSDDGFSDVNKLEKNELLDSGIDPLQIGYGIDGFKFEVVEPDFESGDGHGGKGVGGYGRGGNDGQGHGGSKSNDGLTGLELWWFWQRNHGIHTRRAVPTTLYFSNNDRNQVIDLAAQMLINIMLPKDMTKATLVTEHAIEDIFSLLCEVMFLPLMIPLVQSHEYELVVAGTLFMILGASVTLAAVVSGGVIYGLWRWRNSLQNHDSDDEDSSPQYNDPPVH